MALGGDEASYRGLFEGNPQPMWVCDRNTGRALAVNDAALKLYGYQRNQFLELAAHHLLQDASAVDPDLTSDQVSVTRNVRKDGTFFGARLTWHPCVFEGRPAHLVLVQRGSQTPEPGREELELEMADRMRQLELAQREIDTFSYSVSHDLRAPLRHIDGFGKALLDDYRDSLDPQAVEYLSRICQASARMSALIDALQQLSRVARSELKREPANLSVKAQVISLELSHDAPHREVEFRIEEEVRANADPRLARQLLEILIGNAWKFTSTTERAVIEFGACEAEGKPAYFVRDNGVGFDMAYADKLFAIFHRLHGADEFEGSGVGLAIAHRIVTRHGGRIWAESSPGCGATFYFTL